MFGTNCHSDIEYVLAGCCLFGFNSLNLFSTPYDYEGDEEKILHCFKQKIWQIPYVNMSADDIYITCKRDVMKGFYD